MKYITFIFLFLFTSCDQPTQKYVITSKQFNTDASLGWKYVYNVDFCSTNFKGSHYTNDEHNVGDTILYIND